MGFTVDREKCVGCGACWTAYDGLFRQGADGKSEPIGAAIPADNSGEEIAGICPNRAISYST